MFVESLGAGDVVDQHNEEDTAGGLDKWTHCQNLDVIAP
jgi:hypothetical protein